ncbi:HER family class A beta-lactamase [Superficieibacter electus]|uniref:Beta-lactamase n=1 Tax=Superficieibacter electus TaxID=2022662 RepID=A0A2P5GT59_9ENTR|nr:class A beta-lactamase [Superficieibacter electus]POP46267.1 HER family class A beta-lactamase [Superficieibacter electus]POP49737.1 HER family class A beta-lactamase [Superficieibacter electus]
MQRLAIMVLTLFTLLPPVQAASSAITNVLQQYETRLNARIGMAVVNEHGVPVFSWRQDERFPLTSTFKVLACAALLDKLHKSGGSLEQTVSIQPEKLLEYSPITKNHLSPATLTLRTLCSAAVSYSDNTAANRLLEYLGGPPAVTQFMRSIDDHVTRLDRTEPTLNEATPGDVRDTSTPKNMALALHQLLASDTLSQADRKMLDTWMRDDKVADALLRATLPAGWAIADKTGAGGHGSRAIIAAVYPPEKPPFYLAIYITQTNMPMKAADAAIADIGRQLFNANTPAK